MSTDFLPTRTLHLTAREVAMVADGLEMLIAREDAHQAEDSIVTEATELLLYVSDQESGSWLWPWLLGAALVAGVTALLLLRPA